MPGVFLNEDDYNFDIALRRFKKQVEKAGILSEMKKRPAVRKNRSVMRKKKKACRPQASAEEKRKMNAGLVLSVSSSSRMRKRKGPRGLERSIVLTGVHPVLFGGAPPADERSVSVFVLLVFPRQPGRTIS